MGHHAVDFPWSSFLRALLFGVPALALATTAALLTVSEPYNDMILEFGDGREMPRTLGVEGVVIPALFLAVCGGIGVWLWRRLWIDIAEWRRDRGTPPVDFSLR